MMAKEKTKRKQKQSVGEKCEKTNETEMGKMGINKMCGIHLLSSVLFYRIHIHHNRINSHPPCNIIIIIIVIMSVHREKLTDHSNSTWQIIIFFCLSVCVCLFPSTEYLCMRVCMSRTTVYIMLYVSLPTRIPEDDTRDPFKQSTFAFQI